MTLELLLSIAGAVGALLGGYFTLAKLLFSQIEKRLDERFAAQEAARQEGRRLWDERFTRIEEQQKIFERDLTQLMRELPTSYVRREDAIRENTTINAKLDALNSRIEHFITLRRGTANEH